MSDAKASDLTGDNRKIWEASPPTFVDRRVETILELLPRLGAEAKLLQPELQRHGSGAPESRADDRQAHFLPPDARPGPRCDNGEISTVDPP